MHPSDRALPALAIWCFLAAPHSVAAAAAGSIAGTVTDPSGAAMAAVAVVVANSGTGVVQATQTNGDGFFAFPVLPIGEYQLQVDHPGFKPFQRSRLAVTSGAALRVDIPLALGDHAEAIVVTEFAAQVDTSSTQSGERIAASKIASVPVNGRSFTDLLALQPGVVPASSQQPGAVVMSGCTNTPPSGDLNPGNMSVNGQRETANGFSVNGNSAQEDFNMGAAIVPNLDSIQEFRVLTSNFDAEYGNFSGGQVLVTTKSGSNGLHGSAFEFLRDTSLDARPYLAPERAAYDRNQYGGTLGGQLRKDKVFFFLDYQGTHMTQGVETGLISVPSARNRTGDLSDKADLLTGSVNGDFWAKRLTERLGYGVFAGEPYYFPGCTNPAACVLPNANIPERAWSNRWRPFARGRRRRR